MSSTPTEAAAASTSVKLESKSDTFKFTSSFDMADQEGDALTADNKNGKKEKEVVKLDLVKTSWFALYQNQNVKDTDDINSSISEPSTPGLKSELSNDLLTALPIISRDSVLHNTDLLDCIFRFFQTQYNTDVDGQGHELDYQDPEKKINRLTLLNAALTCKVFKEPALDVLWRVVDTFEPVLMLLPGYDSNRESIRDVINPNDISRLFKYTSRVRHFRVRSSPAMDWFEWIYILLLRYTPSQTPLFPSLKSFYIEHTSSSSWAHRPSLFLASSPTLQVLAIKEFHQSDESLIANLLVHTALASTGLRKLQVWGHVSEKIISVLKRFERLEELDLGFHKVPVSYTILAKLAPMPRLRELKIEANDHPKLKSEWEDAEVTFNTVTTLVLHGEVSVLLRLLGNIRTPNLTHACLKFLTDSSNQTREESIQFLRNCIERFASPHSLHSLQSLTINLPKTSAKKTPSNILVPLKRFTSLRSLSLVCGSMVLNDIDLLSLCACGEWRHLEYLWLLPSTGTPRQGDEVLSLDALRIIKDQCLRLKVLKTCVKIPESSDDVVALQKGNDSASASTISSSMGTGKNCTGTGNLNAVHGLRELWLSELLSMKKGRDDDDSGSENEAETTRARKADLVKTGIEMARYVYGLFPELRRFSV